MTKATATTISTYIPSETVETALLESGCVAYLEEGDAWALESGLVLDVSGTVATVRVQTLDPSLMLDVWAAQDAAALVAILARR